MIRIAESQFAPLVFLYYFVFVHGYMYLWRTISFTWSHAARAGLLGTRPIVDCISLAYLYFSSSPLFLSYTLLLGLGLLLSLFLFLLFIFLCLGFCFPFFSFCLPYIFVLFRPLSLFLVLQREFPFGSPWIHPSGDLPPPGSLWASLIRDNEGKWRSSGLVGRSASTTPE